MEISWAVICAHHLSAFAGLHVLGLLLTSVIDVRMEGYWRGANRRPRKTRQRRMETTKIEWVYDEVCHGRS